MNGDTHFMQRCLELASRGIGRVAPNPMVGAVVVVGNRIIGEGYHHTYGAPHAEVVALQKLIPEDRSKLHAATLYVNLEPCNHHGKTPPCTAHIIKHGVPRVIVAAADPNPKVAGKGIAQLRKQGVDVHTGILKAEAEAVNKRFFSYHARHRPYIILKWAQTSDGFIARSDHTARWISNRFARKLVHRWRAQEQAIMVGGNTLKYDDPALTVRDWTGKDPLRLVIAEDCTDVRKQRIFNKNSGQVIVYNNSLSKEIKGAVFKKIDFTKPVLPRVMEDLYVMEVQSVLVEGGRQLLQSFISAGLWDEARVFTGNTTFSDGLRAPEFSGEPVAVEDIRDNRLVVFKPARP